VISNSPLYPISNTVSFMVWALAVLTACSPRATPTGQASLRDLGTRYAAAWSSRNPDSLASFYAEKGSLTVNAGTPSVGRAAVRATAQEFMAGFPDMLVNMDSVIRQGSHVVFYWTWTGTNNGPGGTGRAVHISGYEEWTLGSDGLIAESKGHYNEAEYHRQVTGMQR